MAVSGGQGKEIEPPKRAEQRSQLIAYDCRCSYPMGLVKLHIPILPSANALNLPAWVPARRPAA